jgi:hypothetical protein
MNLTTHLRTDSSPAANMRFGNSGGRQNSYFNFGNFVELRFQLDRTRPNSRNINSTLLISFNGRRPSVTQLNAPPSPSLVRYSQCVDNLQNCQNNMIPLFDLRENDLKNLSIKDYFKSIELAIESIMSVDELTDFFTNQTYVETKPYLTRRKLIPNDRRFRQIELVYEDSKKVNAIIWDITISLSQLTEIFGEPIIHNEPYSDSTAFAFKSVNQNIEIIKTRHPKWLTMVKSKKGFRYQDKDNHEVELADPEFSFIQFELTTK